jgi:hypothetical protein
LVVCQEVFEIFFQNFLRYYFQCYFIAFGRIENEEIFYEVLTHPRLLTLLLYHIYKKKSIVFDK